MNYKWAILIGVIAAIIKSVFEHRKQKILDQKMKEALKGGEISEDRGA